MKHIKDVVEDYLTNDMSKLGQVHALRVTIESMLLLNNQYQKDLLWNVYFKAFDLSN